MFTEGQLLRFEPFVFKNGGSPKPKYYVVLRNMDGDLMMASLPTSKDHIPESHSSLVGCINIPERGVNAYVIASNCIITDMGFAFPQKTYIYGEQVDEYSQTYLENMGSSIQNLGILNKDVFSALRECLKQSPLIKRKYQRLL